MAAYRHDLIRIRSNLGLPIEVLNSLRLLRTARQAYVDTIVEYNQAHFELYTSLGNPPADMVVRPAADEAAPPAEAE
jgi:outer membrane protein TolC